MLGLTFDKLLLIGVLAVFILGPDRLPYYASKLAQLVKTIKRMADGAKDRMREEMGPEFDEVDWQKLDPRQYDPRRIIRTALLDDEPAAGVAAASVAIKPVSRATPIASAAEKRRMLADEGGTTPFDSEAT